MNAAIRDTGPRRVRRVGAQFTGLSLSVQAASPCRPQPQVWPSGSQMDQTHPGEGSATVVDAEAQAGSVWVTSHSRLGSSPSSKGWTSSRRQPWARSSRSRRSKKCTAKPPCEARRPDRRPIRHARPATGVPPGRWPHGPGSAAPRTPAPSPPRAGRPPRPGPPPAARPRRRQEWADRPRRHLPRRHRLAMDPSDHPDQMCSDSGFSTCVSGPGKNSDTWSSSVQRTT